MVNMVKVLPEYHQHFHFHKCDDQIPDQCYFALKDNHNAVPHPAFGKANRTSILLLMPNTPDLYQTTDWQIFLNAVDRYLND